MTARERALVLGHDKRLARQAMDRFADRYRFIRLDPSSRSLETVAGPDLLRAADQLMASCPFSAVVATSESAMLAAGFLRSQYGLPGLGFEQSLLATSKWRMRTVLGSRVPSPRAWLSGDFLAAGPAGAERVVIKPLSSSSARNVRLTTAAGARAWLRGHDGLWLVETAITVTREFHCDGVFRGGKLAWAETSEYDRPVLGAQGTRATRILPAGDPMRPPLLALAREVIDGLGCAEGVFHMEFLYDGTELSFGEVGLRPGGIGIAELLSLASGADLWGAFVASQLGQGSSGYGPRRQVEDVSGLVIASPGPDGRLPLPAAEAARLPGVIRLADGKLARGEQQSDVCEFEYVVFFRGLDSGSVPSLRETVAAC